MLLNKIKNEKRSTEIWSAKMNEIGHKGKLEVDGRKISY